MRAALDVLSQNDPNGFFLMVEFGLIDKYAHRARHGARVYDTIMLDNAVAPTRDWAARRRRHADPGDRRSQPSQQPDRHHQRRHEPTPNVPMRERVGVYDKAGFPNYPAPDADGYPARVDVSRRLAIFFAEPAGLLRDLPPEAGQSE